jgi:lysophospholipase L1-like esterase
MSESGWNPRTIALATVLLLSLGANVLLFQRLRDQYKAEQLVRLDPTGHAVFSAESEALAASASQSRRIVLFGDSRIAAWSPSIRLEGYELVNRGWGGETTAQALLRVERDVIAVRPAAVVVQLGVNDLKAIGLMRPEERSTAIDGCLERLTAIVERLRARSIPVVLLTIFPTGSTPLHRLPFGLGGTQLAVDAVNARLKTLQTPGVTLVDSASRLCQGDRLRAEYVQDALHLSAAGYRALNPAVEQALREALDPHYPITH